MIAYLWWKKHSMGVWNQMRRHPSLDFLLLQMLGNPNAVQKGKSCFSYNLSSSPIWKIWNAQGSNFMLSASRFTESNRTEDRYLSPKLGKTTCTKQKQKMINGWTNRKLQKANRLSCSYFPFPPRHNHRIFKSHNTKLAIPFYTIFWHSTPQLSSKRLKKEPWGRRSIAWLREGTPLALTVLGSQFVEAERNASGKPTNIIALQFHTNVGGAIIWLTTMSFPAFSGLFAILIAAAAAAPDDIPTWKNFPQSVWCKGQNCSDGKLYTIYNRYFIR